jgi:hypothetical protein
LVDKEYQMAINWTTPSAFFNFYPEINKRNLTSWQLWVREYYQMNKGKMKECAAAYWEAQKMNEVVNEVTDDEMEEMSDEFYTSHPLVWRNPAPRPRPAAIALQKTIQPIAVDSGPSEELVKEMESIRSMFRSMNQPMPGERGLTAIARNNLAKRAQNKRAERKEHRAQLNTRP